MKTSILHHTKTIYADEYAAAYNPIWVYRIKFIARALFYRKALMHLTNNIEAPLLEMLCSRTHRFLEKPFRPYIVKSSPAFNRSDLVVNHYNQVSELFSAANVQQIYTDVAGLMLTEFMIDDIAYSVRLVYEPRYQKEGDMSLVLFSEEDGNFYTLSFTLGVQQGARIIMIGGLQGAPSSESNSLKIKKLTRKLYGQRPKSLMVSLLTLLAKTWGIDTILAVKTHSHTYAAKRYSKGRIKTDYDALWLELGGSDYDRNFYSIDVNTPRRDIEHMSRSKRSMYRRRYEWLDNTKATFEQVLRNG